MKDRVGTLPNVMIIHAGSSARRDDGIGKRPDDGEVYARERERKMTLRISMRRMKGRERYHGGVDAPPARSRNARLVAIRPSMSRSKRIAPDMSCQKRDGKV